MSATTISSPSYLDRGLESLNLDDTRFPHSICLHIHNGAVRSVDTKAMALAGSMFRLSRGNDDRLYVTLLHEAESELEYCFHHSSGSKF